MTDIYPFDPNRRIHLNALDQLIHCILSALTTSQNTDIAFTQLICVYGDWESVLMANRAEILSYVQASIFPEAKAERIHVALQHVWQLSPDRMTLDYMHSMNDIQAYPSLQRIKGVGPKTSCGVLLFSTLRRAMLPVDTHYERFAIRFGLLPGKLNSFMEHELLRKRLPDDWNTLQVERHYLAVKQHGQNVCVAGTPKCHQCCLTDLCGFYNRPRQGRMTFD